MVNNRFQEIRSENLHTGHRIVDHTADRGENDDDIVLEVPEYVHRNEWAMNAGVHFCEACQQQISITVVISDLSYRMKRKRQALGTRSQWSR